MIKKNSWVVPTMAKLPPQSSSVYVPTRDEKSSLEDLSDITNPLSPLNPCNPSNPIWTALLS